MTNTKEPISRDQIVGVIFVLSAIIAWGIYFPFAIILVRKLSVAQFLALRWGIGALTLLILNTGLRRSVRIAKRDWPVVIAATAVGIVIHQIIQVTGLRYTSATNTGWILTLIPPTTGVLGWIFLKEKISWRQVIGLTIGMIGVVLFVSQGYIRQLSFIENRGDVLVLISVCTWSGYTILAKSRLHNYDPLPLTLVFMGIGASAFVILTLVQTGTYIPAMTRTEWIMVVTIGVFPSGLAYFWWNAGLKRLSVINTSMFLFIEAIFASIAGWYFLDESFTLPMVGFAVLIAIGVTISQTRVRKRRSR